MYLDKNISEQILTGFVWAIIIIFSPVVLLYKTFRWLTVASVKETGNRLAKFFGSAFALLLILYAAQVIIQIK